MSDKTTSGAGAADKGTPFSLPANLDGLGVDELDALQSQARTEFDGYYSADGGPQAGDFERVSALADGIETIETRKGQIQAEAEENAAKFQALRDRVAPPAAEGETDEPLEGEIVDAPADPNPALVNASARPRGGAVSAPRELGGLAGPKNRLNPSLSGARTVAPPVEVRPQLAMTASVGLPGKFEPGAPIESQSQLISLIAQRSRNMTVDKGAVRRNALGEIVSARAHTDPFGGVQIASIRNEYEHVFAEDTKQDVIEAWLEKINANRRPSQFETLVAGGGWCAPPENRYDFFNISCEGGMIDLPTFGVTRSGVNFPTSPSLADAFSATGGVNTGEAIGLAPFGAAFTNASVPWLWTNTDDVATVTGSPNKPCIRVPCAAMNPVLLECYGICLTAGNLTDAAWPEATRNFLRLIMSAHYHASNARYISQMISLATVSVTGGGAAAGSGMIAPLLGQAELQAWDYRTKYGMCSDDVMEYVLPAWTVGAIRSDLAKRTGVEPQNGLGITDAQIAAWFDTRNIRVQFVQDYQVRTAGLPGFYSPAGATAWPTTVNGLMYAAGTVARGNGLTLDLGVVRDSTLNAENDFTAAWMEECHLIAKFGHEIRNITTNICTDGTTGAADLTACAP